MPPPPTFTRQHAIGGAIGVALLVFALVYRFFPQALHMTPAHAPARASTQLAAPAPAAVHALTSTESELQAGPPISLAPASVIAARARGRVLAARDGNERIGALLTKADEAAV